MNQTITDIQVDVDAAFEQLQCHSRQGTPHGGGIAAWGELHDCSEGWLCKAHYTRYVDELVPYNRRLFDLRGYHVWPVCGHHFSSDAAFQKVVPL
jgi:hypothetical protein